MRLPRFARNDIYFTEIVFFTDKSEELEAKKNMKVK